MNRSYIIIALVVAVLIAVALYIKAHGVPQLFPQSGPQLTVIPGGVSGSQLTNVEQTLSQYAATSGNNKVNA